MCGLKPSIRKTELTDRRHTLRGCVDWNKAILKEYAALGSHTLRGCVDWNWLERSSKGHRFVTPFVGVWIETAPWSEKQIAHRSHPSWVCGLKLQQNSCISVRFGVTPFVGVWIETLRKTLRLDRYRSHPSWVCGLKPWRNDAPCRQLQSHPSWVCGLKHL